MAGMNKAFVREPDDTGERRCPRCGSLGESVGPETLAAQLRPEGLQAVSESAWFCPFARCEVAYFDALERFVSVDLLRAPAYPKDPTAPLCRCFNFGIDDVEQDLREGGVTRVKALVQRAKSAEARCATMAPNGRSCIGEVQRYFLKRRETYQTDDRNWTPHGE